MWRGSDSNKDNSNEGGRQATAMRAMATATVMMWAMATGTRLVGNKEGKGEFGKGNGNKDEGGG